MVEKMEAVVFSSFLLPSEERVKRRFCSAGCVKCSPVSLALRSDGSSSCVRSECSSSTLSSSGGGNNALLFSFGPFRGGLNQVSRRVPPSRKQGLMMIVSPKVILTEERGSSDDRNAGGSKLFENLKDDVPLLHSLQNGVKSGLPLPDLATVEKEETVDLASKDEFPALGEEDKLWVRIRQEARWDSVKEPVLASYLYSSILSHGSLERALAFHLGNKLSSSTLLSTQLFSLIIDTFMEDDGIRRAVREDIKAVKGRDPACNSYSHCLLNFKGFLACQTHRVAHRLWNQGRQSLALALQSRVSEVFHVDIHPAAKIGSGILFDHATGLVVGETAIIGNNVSILHHVTLGGTGALGGDRHPKIGDGVLIGAGAIILGNVKIGEGAKIGAGSLVLINVPPRTMAVGNPAHLVGGKDSPAQLKEIPSQTMDHTSFMKGWFDYVI